MSTYKGTRMKGLRKITENFSSYVRFEVFTAVTMKNGVFWGVRP
jgi:hypothetical protein